MDFGSFMMIYKFFVIKVGSIPLIFAHGFVSWKFAFALFSQFFHKFLPTLFKWDHMRTWIDEFLLSSLFCMVVRNEHQNFNMLPITMLLVWNCNLFAFAPYSTTITTSTLNTSWSPDVKTCFSLWIWSSLHSCLHCSLCSHLNFLLHSCLHSSSCSCLVISSYECSYLHVYS